MAEPGRDEESAKRPAGVVLTYKRVKGHPRITRIATTLAESGRDVTILGLSRTTEEEEFSVNRRVRGVGVPRFVLRNFILRQALRPLDTLAGWVARLRWKS